MGDHLSQRHQRRAQRIARVFPMLAFASLLAVCNTAPNPIYCDVDDPLLDGCPADRPRCDVAHRTCIAQLSDGGAPIDLRSTVDSGPLYDLPQPICTMSIQCMPAAPICADGNCRACNSDGECLARDAQTPHCAVGLCVQCAAFADCAATPATPVCDGASHVCRACAAHADCPSLLCFPSGACAGSAIFVDNNHCAGGDGSTPQKALCEVQSALTVAAATPATRFYARVAASATSYAAVTLAAGQIELYADPPYRLGQNGPWATVAGSAQPSVSLSGAQSVLLLDGFEITGTTKDAVACSCNVAGPQLTVRESWLHDVTGAGVSASKCAVTVERTLVGPSNALGGLVLTDGSYQVENSFVVENVGFKPAISVAGSATGSLRFVTLADNGSNGTAGAIACAAPATVAHSIVWNNSVAGPGAFYTGACSFDDDDLQTLPMAPGNNESLAPAFVDGGGGHLDYHLTKSAANVACCVDKLPKNQPPVPDDPFDFDGGARPLGAGYDRGAHEIE